MSVSLIQKMSPFYMETPYIEAAEPPKTLILRGLFSTSLTDREREFAEPTSFNLDVFANTGTLLRNHEFIKDAYGNKLPAGKVLKTIPVKIIQENPNNTQEWILKSLISEDIVAFWPKYKSPDLLVGDSGVYAIVEVTHQDVIKQVLNKELGAFSWSGLTHKIPRDKNLTELAQIDLIEVSLVNIPANPNSTFVLTDDTDPALNLEIKLEDCDIYGLRTDKAQYDPETIKRVTKSFSTNTSTISENEDSLFITLGEADLVNPVKCFSFDLGEWTVFAAPKNMNKKHCKLETIKPNKLSEDKLMSKDVQDAPAVIEDKVVAEKLYLLNIEQFMKANPKAVVSVQKTLTIGEAPVEISFIEFPASFEVEDEVVEDEVVETVVEDIVVEDVVVEPVVAVVDAPKDDRLDKLTELVASLTNVVATSLAEKQVAQEKPVEKSLESIKLELAQEFEAKLAKFKKDEEAVEVQRVTLQKSLDKLAAFESTVPDQTLRSEKTESTKSVEPEPIDAKAYFAAHILKGVK